MGVRPPRRRRPRADGGPGGIGGQPHAAGYPLGDVGGEVGGAGCGGRVRGERGGAVAGREVGVVGGAVPDQGAQAAGQVLGLVAQRPGGGAPLVAAQAVPLPVVEQREVGARPDDMRELIEIVEGVAGGAGRTAAAGLVAVAVVAVGGGAGLRSAGGGGG